MKLYNPFKAHLIECDGYYYVRSIGFFVWQFLDSDGNYWWDNSHKFHARYLLEEQARKRLIEFKKSKIKPKKPKVTYIES